MRVSKGIFVTATGTDVGKTYVTALLIKKLRESGKSAGYYKAVLSGAEQVGDAIIPCDADYVNRIADIGDPLNEMVSYVYRTAVSPHLAARLEGNLVDIKCVKRDYLNVCLKHEYVTVEGSGGIICPIRMDEQTIMLTDIIKSLELKILIVANAGLGTINSTVLTVKYAQSCGIEVKGIILNNFHSTDVMEIDNKIIIERITEVPVIACVEYGAKGIKLDAEVLASLYE